MISVRLRWRGGEWSAVVETSETVGGKKVEYALEFRMSNPVPGKLPMPDASNEVARMPAIALWPLKIDGVPAGSVETPDGGADMSAWAADIPTSGIAGAGGLSIRIGGMLTGAAVAGFRDKFESGSESAMVLVAGVCSAAPFNRGFAVEVECEVWIKLAAELCNTLPSTSEKLATNPVRDTRGSAFVAEPWLGEVGAASFAIGIVLDVFIRKISAQLRRGKSTCLTKDWSRDRMEGPAPSASRITTSELNKVFSRFCRDGSG